MDAITIRRNKGLRVPTYQRTVKTGTEKTAGSGQSQETAKTTKTTGLTVSETLRQLMTDGSREATHLRESRQTLQLGEVALDEVQDKLGRIAELIEEAAGGGDLDRAGLQEELEQLREEIDRIMGSASIGGVPLFLDAEGAEDGTEALLRAVMNELPEGQEGIQTLSGWLAEGYTQGALTAAQLLAMLGLDKTAGGTELMAAIMNSPAESNSAAGYLAALYLGAVISGMDLSKAIDPQAALEGLRKLMETIEGGVPQDEAVQTLTDGEYTGISDFQNQFSSGMVPDLQKFLVNLLLANGGLSILPSSALLTAFAGFQGMNLEFMMTLLTTFPNSESGTASTQAGQAGAGSQAEAAPQASRAAASGADAGSGSTGTPPKAAAEADTAAGVGRPADGAVVRQFGNVQVVGRDLSGVSVTNGVLTIGGKSDIMIRGTEQGGQAIQVTGSGTVTLQNVKVPALLLNTPMARIFSVGESVLSEVWMKKGTSLTLGGGLLRIGAFRANESNTLRLTGGAVVMTGKSGEEPGTLNIPVQLDGPVSLAAQAVRVTSFGGKPLEPFDVILKTLLPGWSGITALAVNGRQAKMNLPGGDFPPLARLWLEKGDASHGYPVHSVSIRGRDASGQLKTRYAYLRWDERMRRFQEISMYPNPFAVTGGEEERDWVYDEPSQTLRILSNQVTAISGGAGTDANQTPFSGRIALADSLGAAELTLGGVVCRVSSGRAFSLGRENDVTLLLQSGTDNHFASGKGCAGISLGDATSLCIDCAESSGESGNSAGTLTASGGAGAAGIGRDRAGGRDRTSRIQILGGVITATGTGGGAGIGGALGAPVGDITIRGGTITAAASYHAAAIGAGIRGECGDILITGTARIVKAQGGDPGADIGACLFGSCGKVLLSGGANIGKAGLWTQAGITLQMGEDTVTLPQFRLSSRDLQLDRLRVSTREYAQTARIVIDADRRWVARIQTAYKVLYRQLEQSGLPGVRQDTGMAGNPVRDTDIASTLLKDMRQAILLQSGQAMHSGRGSGDVWQLLW